MNLSGCFERAWASFTKQPVPFAIATVALLVVNAALGYLSRHVAPLGLVSSLVTALVGGGLMIMAVRASGGQQVDVPDVALAFQRPIPFIVVHLATIAGVLLCGVGVFVTGFVFAYAMVYVARGDDFGSALTKSKDLAVGRPGETVLLLLSVVAMNFAGMLVCGIGLFVSIPLSVLLVVEVLGELDGAPGRDAPVT